MQSENSNLDNQYGQYRLEDPELDAMIKAHQRALLDLEEIGSDPFIEETRADISSVKAASSESNREFVHNSLGQKTFNQDDLKEIRIEIKESDINLISVDWVNEWHLKKQAQVSEKPADLERRDFISASLNEVMPPEETTQPKIIPYRRFAYMAAAAVIGIMILLAALTPTSGPEQLFDKYYESFPAVTSGTRGRMTPDREAYEQALGYYKSGNYKEAAAAFRKVTEENGALFYLGMSELENDNIDQAVSCLKHASEIQGTFYKETRWYLGLAYLKKGNKPEAARYFAALANNDGFYSNRAAKILRRLK